MERRRLAAGRELLAADPDDYGCQARIADEYGVNPATVSKWNTAVRKGGIEALKSSTNAGRPPRLTDDQKRRLEHMLLQGALEHGYETDIWTGERVARLIHEEFGVEYNPKYIPEFLDKQLGFSWQKPSRRPRELDPEKVRQWLKTKWEPAKKGRSKASGGSSSLTNRASS